MYPIIRMRPDKIANVAFHHPWIFSGALGRPNPDIRHGCIVQVADPNDKILGTGTYSSRSTIAIRIFEFGDCILDRTWLDRKLREADERRRLMGYGPGTDTTGYRLVFGESDSLPGLVVDRYDDVLVFQLSTAGLDALRPMIIEALVDVFSPGAIVERSDLSVRAEEGLEDVTELHYGEQPGPVEFLEHGRRFVADVLHGQKTGFYLDQKDLRREIVSLARDRVTLNLFSYTGSMGVAALAGGAKSVVQVDSSESALSQCHAHVQNNGLETDRMTIECEDVFQWLGERNEPTFDLVVMDPPALVKSQGDLESGRKAYHFLNRAAMRLVNHGGIFVSSSCSSHFSEDDLAYTLRRASVQAGVKLSILKTVRQSPDHPLSIYFPEALYLKSFICQVRRP